MRLLNCETYEFNQVIDGSLSKYAILSHRWAREELTFRDMKPKRRHRWPSHPGYRKLHDFCHKARTDGYTWVWLDTCCINKDSSAELSEAINSMYDYYQNASVCYAYLVDLPATSSRTDPTRIKAFQNSEWFTRGWTLQELLAPDWIEFLDCNWRNYGTKESLSSHIAAITSISQAILDENPVMVRQGQVSNPPSVAQKLSWASMRKTTRPEDVAYCLLGIFNLNIPLLYGEGEKAFLRLQQEILRTTNDEIIFAWRSSKYASRHLGVLAPSPRAFAQSWKFQRTARYDSQRPPYSLTNIGLDFRGMIIQTEAPKATDQQVMFQRTVLLPLNCTFVYAGTHYTVAIEVSQNHTTDKSLERRPTYRTHAEALYLFDTFKYESASLQARQHSVSGQKGPPIYMMMSQEGRRLSLGQVGQEEEDDNLRRHSSRTATKREQVSLPYDRTFFRTETKREDTSLTHDRKGSFMTSIETQRVKEVPAVRRSVMQETHHPIRRSERSSGVNEYEWRAGRDEESTDVSSIWSWHSKLLTSVLLQRVGLYLYCSIPLRKLYRNSTPASIRPPPRDVIDRSEAYAIVDGTKTRRARAMREHR